MPVKIEDVRKLALALPDTTEEPHHNFGSFRVRGKIFVTIPPGGQLLHIFLPEQKRELALALDPEFLEPVTWGSKVLGVRAHLPIAKKSTVLKLVEEAYEYKLSQVGVRKQSTKRPPARGGDAVGTGIAPRPPHRSVRAELPHTALASGTNDQTPPK